MVLAFVQYRVFLVNLSKILLSGQNLLYIVINMSE